jgi:hypothetical protein
MLLGVTERKLVLSTAKGNPIDNVIELDPNDRTKRKWAAIRAQHPRWEERRPDTGVYNCAGMTWASRRTTILGEYHDILRDDGFRKLHAGEVAQRGDLVLYVDGGLHAHVGVVQGFEQGLVAGGPPIPIVLSKWDSVSGEYFHRLNDHPFGGSVAAELWTDRP